MGPRTLSKAENDYAQILKQHIWYLEFSIIQRMDSLTMLANPQLQPYFTRRNELTVEAGCLLWGMKVLVATKLQKWVLAELYNSHPGMKSLARAYVWCMARNR